MAIFVTVLGALLVSAAVLDIFQTLFHPAGRGAMSDWTAKLTWRFFRIVSAKQAGALTYAGPTAILLIIVSWAALTWLGFALIYFPRLEIGFDFNQSTGGSAHKGFVEAMSLSLGALITLSEGTYAKFHWLQLTRAAEAIMGFGLLTASVSWLLSIYPVLESRRALAQQATLLHRSEHESHLDIVRDAPNRAGDWIMAIGADLASLRNQMSQFPITYYFDMGEPETALAGALSYLFELANRSSSASQPALKIAGTVLGGAVESFLETLAKDFLNLPPGDKQGILRAYASEQMTDLILQKRTLPYAQKKTS